MLMVSLLAVFVLTLAASLYLFSATASIYERYQPGISAFRLSFHPGLIFSTSVGLPLLFALLFTRGRRYAIRLAVALALAAFLSCVAVFWGILVVDPGDLECVSRSPEERELHATLRYSLLCPQSSSRSFAPPFYTALLSLGFFGLARLVNASRRWVRLRAQLLSGSS